MELDGGWDGVFQTLGGSSDRCFDRFFHSVFHIVFLFIESRTVSIA